MTLFQDIATRMRDKTTDELLAIWRKNDRNEWSDDAYQAIKQVLTERGIQVPSQDAYAPPPPSAPKPMKKKQKPPACPSCGSENVKKRFMAGTSTGGTIQALLVLGAIAIGTLLTEHILISLPFFLLVLFVGIAAFTLKRFKCRACGADFNEPAGSQKPHEEPEPKALRRTPPHTQMINGTEHVEFSCEQCGETISFRRKYSGMVERCPRCNERVTVP